MVKEEINGISLGMSISSKLGVTTPLFLDTIIPATGDPSEFVLSADLDGNLPRGCNAGTSSCCLLVRALSLEPLASASML